MQKYKMKRRKAITNAANTQNIAFKIK